jgi:hypothetical protein
MGLLLFRSLEELIKYGVNFTIEDFACYEWEPNSNELVYNITYVLLATQHLQMASLK